MRENWLRAFWEEKLCLSMTSNYDQKFTTISMFTMISMSKISNHRYENSFCEIEPQINILI